MVDLKETLLREKPVLKKFSNGLAAAFWNIPGYQKKYAILESPLGSIQVRVKVEGREVEIPEGTAHFLEHKLFADKEGGSVFDHFASLGASCNAYTSFVGTSYLFSTTENLEKCLDLLLDFVQNLYMTPESIAREKKVIAQEISMYKDHPGWRVFFNLLQNLYFQHPVRNDIAGTRDSIGIIDQDLLRFCHDTFYHPENLVLAVIGDINIEEICDSIARNQARQWSGETPSISFMSPEEPSRVKKKESREQFSLGQPIMQLGFKINEQPRQSRELLARELSFALLADILFGTGSPAFYELYDEGLIDDGFAAGFSGEKSFGYFVIGGGTNHPQELVERIFKVLEKTKKEGIDPADLDRARKKIWGGFVAGLNSLEVLAGQFVKDYRRGLELVDHFSALERITPSHLEMLLHDFLQGEYSSISIVEPPS